MFPEDFIDSKEVLGNVVWYFASFGEAIRDFTVEEFCQEDERDAGKSYKINDFHKMADNQERELIPLKLESSGTLKIFALYPSLKDVLVKLFHYGNKVKAIQLRLVGKIHDKIKKM